MTADELIHEFSKGLLKWYRFRAGDRALYVSEETPMDCSIAEALSEGGLEVTVVSAKEWEARRMISDMRFDYAVVADALVSSPHKKFAQKLLKLIHGSLKERGCLFVCTDNRLGIRYFCGDQDPYTGRNFDGVENYRRVRPEDHERQAGRLYAKAELAELLERAGFSNRRFYSVFPGIFRPQILVAEDYMPAEELAVRLFPQYNNPNTVFLEEENLYTSLIQNGMFHTMANGFLIECPLDGIFSNANQITVSMDRGEENALCTIIRRDRLVEKRPLYPQGREKLLRLMEGQKELEDFGVQMLKGQLFEDAYVMPYASGKPLVNYFRELAEQNQEEFYRQLDRLWGLILSSSEHVPYAEMDWERFDPRWEEQERKNPNKRIEREKWRKLVQSKQGVEVFGPILKHGYIDLVLLNGFWMEGEFVFYDQELFVKNLPAKTILIRNIDLLYYRNSRMQAVLPKNLLFERYGLEEYQEIYYAYAGCFLTRLRNDDLLRSYNGRWRSDHGILNSNRQRMNYSTEEYLRLFVHIFHNLDNKKLFLFGSGKFTKKFLALYKEEYEIEAILDNNEEKWGTELEGFPILRPGVLADFEPGTFKVIICIKNYLGVLRQLKELGVLDIGIYDTNMEYPRRPRVIAADESAGVSTERKKYHVGYVAGVFDLFHIGHLNLLRRAKEQCDYLIVGVVTDEGVRKNKCVENYVPFEERLAIVQACRYVDEAVGIPLEFGDTRDAYLKFKFDVQFSGSDYAEDPVWLEKREFLRRHGAELVFFPYTQSTSSTKLKQLIDSRLSDADSVHR